MKMEKIKQEKEGQDMKEENEKKKEYLLSYKKYKQEAKRLGEQLDVWFCRTCLRRIIRKIYRIIWYGGKN